jgi:hypothetical protein
MIGIVHNNPRIEKKKNAIFLARMGLFNQSAVTTMGEIGYAMESNSQ